MRWILLDEEGTELGRFSSYESIANFVGCTKQHIYRYQNECVFKFKKKKYKINDRLA